MTVTIGFDPDGGWKKQGLREATGARMVIAEKILCCSGQSWLLFQTNAGDHSRLGAGETVVALFYILAKSLTKFLMMENANLQERFPHYLKAKHLFTFPGLLQGLALCPWPWEGTGQEQSSWEPSKADVRLPGSFTDG